MIQDTFFTPKPIYCPLHPKQRATYICTDTSNQNPPFLCPLCYNDPRRYALYPNQSSLKPIQQGIQSISTLIRSHSKSMEVVFERTIGHRDNQAIRQGLQKGRGLGQQIESRLQSVNMQVEVEMERLLRQFQNKIQAQKAELRRKMEQYKQQVISNMEFIRKECLQLLSYQHSLRYYNNPNTLALKLTRQSQRNSTQWFLQLKAALNRISAITQNPSFANSLMYTLTKLNKTNMLALPPLGKEIQQVDPHGDLKGVVKRHMLGLVELPQLVDLSLLKANDYLAGKYGNYNST